MKICKFCGRKVEKLVDSHIPPRAFFEYSRAKTMEDKSQAMLMITNTKGQFPRRKVRTGWYDPNLVCLECERRFAPYDDYVAKLFINEENKFRPIIVNGEVSGWELLRFDYKKLNLFFTSLLWRAGASSLPQFRKVRLGAELGRIKQSILKDISASEISFILARFPDAMGMSFVVDPRPETKRSIFGNLNVYRFYLGAGYIAYIKVGTKPFPHPSSLFVVSEGQPLRILCRGEFKASKELESMQSVITDAEKTLVEIKTPKNR